MFSLAKYGTRPKYNGMGKKELYQSSKQIKACLLALKKKKKKKKKKKELGIAFKILSFNWACTLTSGTNGKRITI